MTRTIASLLIGASVIAIGGCGGSTSSKPLTRTELTAKANAICRRVIAEVDWSKGTPLSSVAVVDRLAALEERAAAELEKLTPPQSMLGQWRLIVDGFRLTGPEFRLMAKQAQERHETAYVLGLSNSQHERGLAAKIAGIKSCEQY